jgi:histidinol-phosphatase (PHP family)
MIDFHSDGHIHTSRCLHAAGEMEDYVQSAISAGLKSICFLEHLEIGINYPHRTWLTLQDFGDYYHEGAGLKKKYKTKLDISIGVEVGYNPKKVKEICCFLASYEWDRIGISYHYLEIEQQHYNVVSRRKYNLDALARHGVAKVVEMYLAGLHSAVNELPGQVVCHLDAVLRHHFEPVTLLDNFKTIEAILQDMVKNKMALEINTSGYLSRDEPFPGKKIVQTALGLGIALQPGSDSHHPRDVGRFFSRCQQDISNW